MLEATAYRYLARPRLHPDELGPEGMNCRGLTQEWFWDQHRQWLGRDQIEQPGLWRHTGAFLVAGEPVMVHATATQGCLCIWGLEIFVRHYRLVAAKNVAPAPPGSSA